MYYLMLFWENLHRSHSTRFLIIVLITMVLRSYFRAKLKELSKFDTKLYKENKVYKDGTVFLFKIYVKRPLKRWIKILGTHKIPFKLGVQSNKLNVNWYFTNKTFSDFICFLETIKRGWKRVFIFQSQFRFDLTCRIGLKISPVLLHRNEGGSKGRAYPTPRDHLTHL